MRQALSPGMLVCRLGPGADQDGTRGTGGRRGEARNIGELGRRRGQVRAVRLTRAQRPVLWPDNEVWMEGAITAGEPCGARRTDQFVSAIFRSYLRFNRDERMEVEEAEPAADAALRCGARRTD